MMLYEELGKEGTVCQDVLPEITVEFSSQK